MPKADPLICVIYCLHGIECSQCMCPVHQYFKHTVVRAQSENDATRTALNKVSEFSPNRKQCKVKIQNVCETCRDM